LKLVKVARHPMLQALISVLFETGGRVGEVLSLRKSNFILSHPEVILVMKMPVLKRYEKVEKIPDQTKKSGYRWKTKKKEDYRTIPIPRNSPLVPYILGYLNKLKSDELLFPFTRQTAFNYIRKIGKRLDKDLELYPHWFRAQKASYLASVHDYDVFSLKEFFKWKDDKMAEFYASLGWKGLARKMGVKVD